MAKMAKVKQTDYTKGGKAISDTAIPLYQNALTQYNDLSSNYQDYLDDTIKKYYSNTADQSDFLRNYKRAMGNTTANNYAATSGGYSSSGQRAYADQQRYQNDLASRLQQQGITGAQNILQSQIGDIATGIGLYDNAYEKGANYSHWDQYNDLVDQNNSATNQVGGVMSTVGKGLSAIPNPWTQAIGAALQVGGNAMSTDTSGAFASIGASSGGSSSQGGGWSSVLGGIGDSVSNAYSKGAFSNLFGGSSSGTGTTTSSSSSNGLWSLPTSNDSVVTSKFSFSK